MKEKLFIALCCFALCSLVHAQDIHFSQVNHSPLTLNPGLAGANYDMQALVNYRSQWNSVSSPFQTIACSFDFRLNPNKRRKKAHFAMGLNFFNDKVGTTNLVTNNANLTFATHVLLSKNSTLGAGISVGWLQRSIVSQNGMWDSQYNGMHYDPTISSGEIFTNTNFSVLDAAAGLVYTYASTESFMSRNNSKILNVGFSAFHLSRPNYSFISIEGEKMNMRFSAFVNGSFGIKNSKLLVEPAIYFHNQGKFRELVYGTYGRLILQGASKATGFVKKTSIALGLFCRNQDALITKFHFEWNGVGLGLSYDLNISKLAQVSRARGGTEISLRWVMGDLNFNRTSSTYRKRKYAF